MSDPAADLAVARGLRVLIHAADPVRRDRLRKLIVEAGHELVDALEAADVVLSDGDCPSIASRPVVAVGGSDTDHAGLLADDAAASQIDAALCAVAAGLTVRSPGTALPGFAAMDDYSLQALFTPLARRLNISLHTVKFHIELLFRKLGVRTRTEALAKARERRHIDTREL